MKKLSFLIVLWFCFNGTVSFAQNVGISPSGSAPDASAGLDVNFTDRGLLIPRVSLANTTTASPVTDPATSLLVYNTATTGDVTPGYYFWNGTAWTRLSASLDGSGTENYFPKWTGTSTLGSSQVYDDGTNVGIGTATPGAKLEVAGTLKITDGTQGANKILTSDTNGVASWENSELTGLISEASFNDCFYVVGSADAGLYPLSLAVSGDYAYVLSNLSNTMGIYNVADPTNPVWVSYVDTGPGTYSVAVSGNYAYVTNIDSHTMTVYDVSDPNFPFLLSWVYTEFLPINIFVKGNYAYIVNNGSGSMCIYNISNPANPTITSVISTGSSPNAVTVSDNYAYVVNSGSNNMFIYDISNPNVPILVSTVNTEIGPCYVAVSGNYAFVANVNSLSMTVYNVSDPGNPFQTGSVATGYYPSSLAVSGNVALLTNDIENTMNIYDVSDPSNPALVDIVSTGQSPCAMRVQDQYAYVIDCGDNELQVIKISCPQTILLQNGDVVLAPETWSASEMNIYNSNIGNVGIGTTSPSAKLDVAGTMKLKDGTQGADKVLTSDENGFASWQNTEITDLFLSQPVGCLQIAGSASTGSGPRCIAVSGNFTYVLNYYSNSMTIYNTSNPANPIITDSVNTMAGPFSLAVSGNYVYVANRSSNTMSVYNVSDPANPYQVSYINTGLEPYSIAVSNNYAYIVHNSSDDLNIYNVNDPANPTLVGTVYTGYNCLFVAVSGDFAYVLNEPNHTMKVYNVSNPSSPFLTGLTTTGLWSFSVAISGNWAYVPSYNNTLTVFDISNPTAPTAVNTISTYEWPRYVLVSGQYLYLTCVGSNNLAIYDISNPSSPILAGMQNIASGGLAVAVSGNYAYLVNFNNNTIQTIQVKCPQINIEVQNGEMVLNNPAWISSNTNIYNLNLGNVGIGTISPSAKLDVAGGNIRTSNQFVSTLAAGTSPLQVLSNTLVTNLNADLLDGLHAGNTDGQIPISNSTVNTNLNADLLDGLHAGNTDGQIPISNSTVNTNLNADLLDGQHADGFIKNQTATDQAAGFRITGNGIFNGGNVGIGTLTPSTKLDVVGGSVKTTNQLISTVATGTAPLSVNSTTLVSNLNSDQLDGQHASSFAPASGSGNYIRNSTALQSSSNFNISGNGYIAGNVGIGTTTPGEKLDVAGGVRAKFNLWLLSNNDSQTLAGMRHDGNNLLYVYNDNACNTGVYLAEGGTSWLAFSDARLKKDVEPFGNILDNVCQLNAKRFHMITDPDTMTKRMGFIAQDVQRLFPDLVDCSSGYFALSYSDFGVLSIEAIKELRAEKDAEIAALKNENGELEKRLESLQAQIEQIQQYLEMSSQK